MFHWAKQRTRTFAQAQMESPDESKVSEWNTHERWPTQPPELKNGSFFDGQLGRTANILAHSLAERQTSFDVKFFSPRLVELSGYVVVGFQSCQLWTLMGKQATRLESSESGKQDTIDEVQSALTELQSTPRSVNGSRIGPAYAFADKKRLARVFLRHRSIPRLSQV